MLKDTCLKCSAKRSPDSDPDYPLCDAHMVACSKCHRGISPDSALSNVSDKLCEIHLKEQEGGETDGKS